MLIVGVRESAEHHPSAVERWRSCVHRPVLALESLADRELARHGPGIAMKSFGGARRERSASVGDRCPEPHHRSTRATGEDGSEPPACIAWARRAIDAL